MKYWIGFLFALLLVVLFGSCHKNESTDKTKPFIVVSGSNPVYTELDSSYTDSGAKAYNIQENGCALDISDRLQVTDNVNIRKREIIQSITT